MSKYLLDEIKLHPLLAPQDVVKLCYQAAFGAEHLLSNPTQALGYFFEEYEDTLVDDKPLTEYISPTVCRVNLSAWKRLKLNPDWLWRLFLSASNHSLMSDETSLEDFITQADYLCKTGSFPFSYDQWVEYINDYKRNVPSPPVRHSAMYRENAKPAYRILSGLAAKVLPIFELMSGMDKGVIAIDGRAASGKTTLTRYLCDIIPAGNIAMDDFFLPPELRTIERLSKPGGNIHHERFTQDVLPHIRSDKGFLYRKFDCNKMEYNNNLTEVIPSPWRIVEGVYSFHPELGKYMDVRVSLDINPTEQSSRIKARNNAKVANEYLTKWVPMEEAYFNEYNIYEAADIVIRI
ncbi:MAG: hypothetical protein FWC92_01325 [Defluviitaleaceae bacterium]|nr:hypothetical protein [Defluviitaleaceae bacterium]